MKLVTHPDADKCAKCRNPLDPNRTPEEMHFVFTMDGGTERFAGEACDECVAVARTDGRLRTEAPPVAYDPVIAHFGACPVCKQNDGSYCNVGRRHLFFCSEHKVAWWAPGENLISTWRGQTQEEQRDALEQIRGYRITPEA